jgi:hypothetical protein
MAPRKVEVSSKADMDASISAYIARGFVVMNKTETSAMLIKKKVFSIPIAILGFLFCFIGLGIYAVVYACQSDEVVEIVMVSGS